MKFHTGPQFEFPRRRIHRAPGRRQAGDQTRALVRMRQRVKNMVAHIQIGLRSQKMRVDGGHVGGQADAKIGGMRTAPEQATKDEG